MLKQLVQQTKKSWQQRKQKNTSVLVQKASKAQQAGNISLAKKLYTQALNQDPLNVEALYLFGTLQGSQGKHHEAKVLLTRAITIDPNNPENYVSLGNSYFMEGEHNHALSHYKEALSRSPELVLANLNIGVCYRTIGALEEAEHHLAVAIRLEPKRPDTHLNLGLCLRAQNKPNKAMDHFKIADELAPGFAIKEIAVTLTNKQAYQEAIDYINHSIAHQPNNANAHAALGYVLLCSDQFSASKKSFKRAIKIQPLDPDIWSNLGILYQNMGHLNDALMAYDKAIELNPAAIKPQLHRSLARLLAGEFSKAWQDYELRRVDPEIPVRQFPIKSWKGESLDKKTILIYGEQGLGDEIMFSSCLPDLIKQTEQCVIDCASKIAPLIQRSFPSTTVHATDSTGNLSWLNTRPKADYAISIGSLPLHFRNNENSFPKHNGYFISDPERQKNWEKRLSQLGSGLKVGISWQGGAAQTNRHRRSIPLHRWLPILNTEHTHFINLQYGECEQEITQLHEDHHIKIHHWQEAIDNYEETAALVSSLDLIISVQTAIIHLSGALGKPVWVMVPVCPEWRYLNQGDKMPWYPSAKIFRQRKIFEWDDTINTVAHDLQSFHNSHKNIQFRV